MEKIAVANSRNSHKTIITVTRYGNVMGSRGSVIPLFLDQIKKNKPITITDLNMTRFMMDLNEAIDLVLYAFEMGDNGDIFVQKSPAASIDVLVKAILKILDKKNYPITNIGVRHGEKLYETLISAEEYKIATEENNFYRIKSDNRDLNYSKFYENGLISSNASKNANIDYNSNNTRQLTVEELSQILRKLDFFINKF
jgi:UDP-glucose 4-epimerase